eukprot:964018_1
MEGHRPWERTSYHYLLMMIRMKICLIVIVIYISSMPQWYETKSVTDADCIIWLAHIKVDFNDVKKLYIFIPHPGLSARRQHIPEVEYPTHIRKWKSTQLKESKHTQRLMMHQRYIRIICIAFITRETSSVNNETNKGDDDGHKQNDESPPESTHFYHKRLNGDRANRPPRTHEEATFPLIYTCSARILMTVCNALRAMVDVRVEWSGWCTQNMPKMAMKRSKMMK